MYARGMCAVCLARLSGEGARDLVRGRSRASQVGLGRFKDRYGCSQGARARGASARSWECDCETRADPVDVKCAYGACAQSQPIRVLRELMEAKM